jgi:hypothetical protein
LAWPIAVRWLCFSEFAKDLNHRLSQTRHSDNGPFCRTKADSIRTITESIAIHYLIANATWSNAGQCVGGCQVLGILLVANAASRNVKRNNGQRFTTLIFFLFL